MKILNKIDKAIDRLNKMVELNKSFGSRDYDLDYLSKYLQDSYQMELEINNLTAKKDALNVIKGKDIDLYKKYQVYKDDTFSVHLSFNINVETVTPYFYIEEGGNWIYNNFYGSWSGMNEWVTKLICTMYEYKLNFLANNWAEGNNAIKHLMLVANQRYLTNDASGILDLHKFITDEKVLKRISDILSEVFTKFEVKEDSNEQDS